MLTHFHARRCHTSSSVASRESFLLVSAFSARSFLVSCPGQNCIEKLRAHRSYKYCMWGHLTDYFLPSVLPWKVRGDLCRLLFRSLCRSAMLWDAVWVGLESVRAIAHSDLLLAVTTGTRAVPNLVTSCRHFFHDGCASAHFTHACLATAAAECTRRTD